MRFPEATGGSPHGLHWANGFEFALSPYVSGKPHFARDQDSNDCKQDCKAENSELSVLAVIEDQCSEYRHPKTG